MKNDAPMTIGKVAKALEIPPSTARQYVKDFQHTGEFSASATPAPGQTRLFNNDDIGIMWTIKFLRAQRKSTDDIAAALIAGDRFYPDKETTPDDNQAAQDAPGETQTEETAMTIYGAFSETLKLYESRVSAYETELKEERVARLAAEIRATAAETKLHILETQKTAEENTLTWRDRFRILFTGESDKKQVAVDDHSFVAAGDAFPDVGRPSAAAQPPPVP